MIQSDNGFTATTLSIGRNFLRYYSCWIDYGLYVHYLTLFFCLMVMAGCNTNGELAEAATRHLPEGQCSGKHLTGTSQVAQARFVPLCSVSFTCHCLIEALYSNHLVPSSTMTYTVTLPLISSVGLYSPLI